MGSWNCGQGWYGKQADNSATPRAGGGREGEPWCRGTMESRSYRRLRSIARSFSGPLYEASSQQLSLERVGGSGVRKIGIILNGVTGRMGTNQHLLRSLVPIIAEGGIVISPGERLLPELMLLGRSESKLAALCARAKAEAGVECQYSTDLDACLQDSKWDVYFDTQTTIRRAPAVRAAVAAGKHIYCEKPVSDSTETATELAEICEAAGVKNGVVQDKLFLPGIIKLRRAIEKGFFGRILSVRGEFGYWVFEGDSVPANRPSWNYRRAEGGGIIIDMLAHWRYVLDNLFGKVQAVSCLGATHIPERVDETGKTYSSDADDAACESAAGVGCCGHYNCSC